MPDWVSVIILGCLEGITEFLPVSSTGHLLLAEHWLGHKSDMFNVVIQIGAVLAVVLVFARRVGELLTGWAKPEVRDYAFKLAAAFLITAVGGLLLKKMDVRLPKDPEPVAWATLIGGVAFLAIEVLLKDRPASEKVTWTVALVMGWAQLIAAVFPGASRSGATILMALALGLGRPAAVEFSFLLGIPTLLAAGAKETYDAMTDGTPHEPWNMIVLGLVVSAITAFISVKWLVGFIRNHTFIPFGWYRIAMGALILLLLR
ncbi:MAG TPA: undecaprenyl-diphosphate phosphatase [Verrucomicrobiota bacterium]|nr:undecaprenyl-diphosphate phosphatase [Verrucomicrobiales bacterium]HRI13177.1 undecaprenyl-diphosphate phosphatase [Verrucomicrobiota bacterium]